jgi:type IV pilus assembly protein PilO
MASLPRIVTLHDFKISSKNNNANNLKMEIVAKTYRYKDEDA